MREAIYRRSGIKIEGISGAEEAQLIYKGVSKKIDLSQKDFLLADIGGGSLELSAIRNGIFQEGKSFNLGTVRVLEGGPTVKEAFQREGIDNFLLEHFSSCDSLKMVGTGGNYRTILKLNSKIFANNAPFVYPGQLPHMYEQLEKFSPLQRMKKFSLRRDRADVILPALQIVMALVKKLKVKKIYCPDIGPIHGVFWTLAEDPTSGHTLSS